MLRKAKTSGGGRNFCLAKFPREEIYTRQTFSRRNYLKLLYHPVHHTCGSKWALEWFTAAVVDSFTPPTGAVEVTLHGAYTPSQLSVESLAATEDGALLIAPSVTCCSTCCSAASVASCRGVSIAVSGVADEGSTNAAESPETGTRTHPINTSDSPASSSLPNLRGKGSFVYYSWGHCKNIQQELF